MVRAGRPRVVAQRRLLDTQNEKMAARERAAGTLPSARAGDPGAGARAGEQPLGLGAEEPEAGAQAEGLPLELRA